jgi:hypothetical protein
MTDRSLKRGSDEGREGKKMKPNLRILQERLSINNKVCYGWWLPQTPR